MPHRKNGGLGALLELPFISKRCVAILDIKENYTLMWSLNCNHVVKHDMIATVTSKTMMSHLDRGF
jgi:hypothetical protein